MTKSALLVCAPKPLSGRAMNVPRSRDGIMPEKPGIGWPWYGGVTPLAGAANWPETGPGCR
jgi:hypothetical protein